MYPRQAHAPALFLLIALAAWGGVNSPARAGRLLVAEEERAGDTRLRGSRYEISADGLRMTGVRGSALSTIIYRRAGGRFFLIDEKGSFYREVKRAQILAALAKAREALNTLEAEAAKISGKDKETALALLDAGRKLLKDAAGGEEQEPEYRLAGEEPGPLGLLCKKYEAFVGDRKTAEVWTAPAAQAGLSEEELAVLDEAGGLFETAVSSLTGIKETSSFLPRARPGVYEGVPVRRIRFRDGKPASDWRLSASEPAEFAPEHFAPPQEFKKKTLLD